MNNTFECPRCGQTIGNMQVHSDSECERQQEINRKNLGIKCPWCGAGAQDEHKEGCPRRRKQPHGYNYHTYTWCKTKDLEDDVTVEFRHPHRPG